MRFPWKKMAAAWDQGSSSATPSPRRAKRMAFSWDSLEDRKVMSHGGGFHQLQAAVHVASTAHVSSTTSTSTTTSSTNSTLTTARQTLQSDILAIEGNSGTTIGELTAIHTTFQTLMTDGLTPSSQSALSSFENSLVTSYASGTTLTGNTTLLGQFEALYTSTPTTQQTTDLTAAYNALAAAVTSSNITSANIKTIDTDFAAVLAAESSTSTATFNYFSLVTGTATSGGGHGGFGGSC